MGQFAFQDVPGELIFRSQDPVIGPELSGERTGGQVE